MKKLFLLLSIGLVSCTNVPKTTDEYVTATEEVTLTAETEITDPVDYSGPTETVYSFFYVSHRE
jgi:hypothetical protein